MMNRSVAEYKNSFKYQLAQAFVEQETQLFEGTYFTNGEDFFLMTPSTISIPIDFESEYIPIDEDLDQDNIYDFEIDQTLWEDYLQSKQYGYSYIIRAWLEATGEELEDNGDIPYWVNEQFCSDIINFARDTEVFSKIIEEIEEEHFDNCVGFVYESVLEKPWTED